MKSLCIKEWYVVMQYISRRVDEVIG